MVINEPTLFDLPETVTTATLYDHANTDHGHLLLATEFGDWMFVWTGVLHTYFPGVTGAIQLTADQLQALGDYCLQMAKRLENR